MEDIKAIETEYNGYRFRSRLEARWAVFFDAVGVKYEYEPEGYENKHGDWYLPDFYLPDYQVYIEVKPNRNGGLPDLRKPLRVMASGNLFCTLIILSDIPNIPSDQRDWKWADKMHPVFYRDTRWPDCIFPGFCTFHYYDKFDINYETDEDETPGFWVGPDYKIKRFPASLHPLERYKLFVIGNQIDIDDRDIILKAYRKARSARFEHGEKPDTGGVKQG